MPFEYLREIAQAELPLTVTDEACIDKLRVLRAADMVAVMLPHPESHQQFARVLALTAKGQALLEKAGESRRKLITIQNVLGTGKTSPSHTD